MSLPQSAEIALNTRSENPPGDHLRSSVPPPVIRRNRINAQTFASLYRLTPANSIVVGSRAPGFPKPGIAAAARPPFAGANARVRLEPVNRASRQCEARSLGLTNRGARPRRDRRPGRQATSNAFQGPLRSGTTPPCPPPVALPVRTSRPRRRPRHSKTSGGTGVGTGFANAPSVANVCAVGYKTRWPGRWELGRDTPEFSCNPLPASPSRSTRSCTIRC